MRKLFILAVSCIILGVGGYTAYRGYRVWKQQHLLTMAHKFVEQSDNRNALLCLQMALASDPRNIEACRLAADVLQSQHAPEALTWRRRVVELDPKSTEDRIALAETAGSLRAFAIASNALADLDPQAKKTATYNNLAGSIAAAAGRLDEARGDFGEAVRLDPNNPKFQFNLALIELIWIDDPIELITIANTGMPIAKYN